MNIAPPPPPNYRSSYATEQGTLFTERKACSL